MRPRLVQAIAAGFAVYGLVAACTDPPLHDYCTGIPEGGCPGVNAYNCEDTSCEAIYSNDPDCTWTLVQKCPNYKPPPPDAGAPDAGDAGDAGDATVDGRSNGPRDAGFPLPDGAAGSPLCPELQSPDCTVDEALACSDCCGCQAIWTCSGGADAGWDLWGVCDDAGQVEPVPGET